MLLKKKKKVINPYLMVIGSFLLIIALGGLLLCLPFFRKDGNWGSFIDAIFTATSATCVTGLCTYSGGIGGELTFGGQIIVLAMIQIGGLGFITVLTFFITLFASKLDFGDRYVIAQMVNSNSISDVVKFVRKIVVITIIVELIGAIIGLPIYLKMYGSDIKSAIFASIFMSISSFNNAGFDIFGSTSLIKGAGNALIDNLSPFYYSYLRIYLMILIALGGISFLVILDVVQGKKKPSNWNAFTKIVLFTTGLLISLGFLLFVLFDCLKSENPMNILDALFQSITCRTAGFATYPQENLSIGGQIVSCTLMFIGGSPLSTAGGIKTTTFFIIVLSVICYFRRRQVSAFRRKYSQNMVIKAMTLSIIALFTVVTGYLLINIFEGYKVNSNYVAFEVFSAFGTTGLTASLTPTLNLGSKIVLICLMFLGRLGPMTFFQVFQANIDTKKDMHYDLIEEDFLIG